MTQEQIEKILEIGVALTAEHDRELLLSAILDAGMDLCNCDAGTLYLLEDDGLHFCRMNTRSMGVRQGGHDNPIALPPVPLTPSHICARAVLDKKLINVPDVHDNEEFDFSGAKRYDAMTGYNTRSMMVTPLVNDKGTIIGVMQLINALNENGEVQDFTTEMEGILHTISSQAAISITNMQYAERVNLLLDSLVQSLSTAIDEITPYNANHTRNMVKYADTFIDWLNEQESDWKFNETQKRAFLMSVGLHDVGKLTVPLDVMDKQNRLTPEDLLSVTARFDRMALVFKIDYLEDRISKEQYEALCAERDKAIDLILNINTAGFLPDDKLSMLEEIANKIFVNENGETEEWLRPAELHCLSIRKGTLTAEERTVMENHVVATAKILEKVSFPKEYLMVPEWAADHHELLNGRGYPLHKKGDEICKEVRLLSILDVFDALTAKDRPYKPGMPVEKALSILHSMVEEGSLDNDILELFEQSKSWEEK